MRSVFETTIRYLGGLLSAYELSGGKHGFLVDKAKEVTDKMAYAWVQSVSDSVTSVIHRTKALNQRTKQFLSDSSILQRTRPLLTRQVIGSFIFIRCAHTPLV